LPGLDRSLFQPPRRDFLERPQSAAPSLSSSSAFDRFHPPASHLTPSSQSQTLLANQIGKSSDKHFFSPSLYSWLRLHSKFRQIIQVHVSEIWSPLYRPFQEVLWVKNKVSFWFLSKNSNFAKLIFIQ
jgi:hypothetical protein